MGKRKEAALELSKLLDGFIKSDGDDERATLFEEFLDKLVDEISARQAETLFGWHRGISLEPCNTQK